MNNISIPSSPDFTRVFSRAEQFPMTPEEQDILTDQLTNLKEYYQNSDILPSSQAKYELDILHSEVKGNAEFLLSQGLPVQTPADYTIFQSFLRVIYPDFTVPDFSILQTFFQSQGNKKLFLNLDYENMERIFISQEDNITHSTGIAFFSLHDGNIVPIPQSEQISFVHGWDRIERYETEELETVEKYTSM